MKASRRYNHDTRWRHSLKKAFSPGEENRRPELPEEYPLRLQRRGGARGLIVNSRHQPQQRGGVGQFVFFLVDGAE